MLKTSGNIRPRPLFLTIFTLVFGILLISLPGRQSFAIDVGCGRAIVLTLEEPYRGTTIRAPSRVNSYGCTDWNEGGPEVVHRITTTFIQANITATLSNLDGVDLDVFILKENQCESDICEAGNYSATYTQAPPGNHYIVVDGCNGAAGSYTLTVNITSDPCADIACDDDNPCTEDFCDPATGCLNMLVDCDDGNNSTLDSCDPGTGECRHSFICYPPRIISTPPELVMVGQAYYYEVEAEDPDSRLLTYSLEVSPAGMAIDLYSGLLRWVPSSLEVGDHPIMIMVEDETGQSDRQTYTLSVRAAEFIFRGHVYQGFPPEIDLPVSRATVELYGDADDQPDNGPQILLASSVTNRSGEFSLTWLKSGDYPYLHLIKNNPAGLYSTGAQAIEPGYLKNITTISYQNNEDLLPGTYSGLKFWAEQISFSPASFGPSAEHLHFDDLSIRVPVKSQFTMKGVLLQTEDGNPLQVVTTEQMSGGHPQSLPYAVSTGDHSPALEILFLSPRNRVGFTFFLNAIEEETLAMLRAYDADDHLIQETSFQVVPKVLRDTNTFFLGLETEQAIIRRITFNYAGLRAAKIIDDLLIEPAYEESVSIEYWQTMLLSPEAIQKEKLAAIDGLQLQPSRQTSQILQCVASDGPDLYVRERAIMALAQVRDPEAIQTLVAIGLNPPSEEIRMAVSNAIYNLRQIFPLPDLPEVNIEAKSPIQLGQEFEVEAYITSPVNRDNVQIAFSRGKLLTQRRGEFPDGYKGPLVAGQPVILRAKFLATEAGRTKAMLTVRLNLNRVDTSIYRVFLYLEIQASGGSASLTPFPDLNETNKHLIRIDYE